MTSRPAFRRRAHDLTDSDDTDTRRVDEAEQVETLRRLAGHLAGDPVPRGARSCARHDATPAASPVATRKAS